MDFPIAEFLDEDACYQKIVAILHPDGLACPRCQSRDGFRVHRRTRDPVLDSRGSCGRVFNAFTGTVFAKTHRRPAAIFLILRGIRPGHDPGAAGARIEAAPATPAAIAAPPPGAGAPRRRPLAVGGHGGRGRRDVPERGGKKASRTPTRSTRHAVVATNGPATAALPMIVLRSPVWSGAARGPSGSASWCTRTGPRSGSSCGG